MSLEYKTLNKTKLTFLTIVLRIIETISKNSLIKTTKSTSTGSFQWLIKTLTKLLISLSKKRQRKFRGAVQIAGLTKIKSFNYPKKYKLLWANLQMKRKRISGSTSFWKSSKMRMKISSKKIRQNKNKKLKGLVKQSQQTFRLSKDKPKSFQMRNFTKTIPLLSMKLKSGFQRASSCKKPKLLKISGKLMGQPRQNN